MESLSPRQADNGKLRGCLTQVHQRMAVYEGNRVYTFNLQFCTLDSSKNYVTYEKKDLKNIGHAYAITIHKSQGSEFEHVLMPICNKYYIMLYNKLLYTVYCIVYEFLHLA